MKYEWLPTGWIEAAQDETQWNETRRNLEQTIQRLLRASEALPYAAVVGELADEHAQVCILVFAQKRPRLTSYLTSQFKINFKCNFVQGTVDKLIGKALLAVDYISDSLTKEQILPLVSVIATLMLIGAAGYGMSYLA